MIKLTTKILPNETFYSWISRIAIRVGDGFGEGFIKQVYKNNRTFPSLLFIGNLNKDFFNNVLKFIDYKELLEEHTLFKYYVRFVDYKRIKNLYKIALEDCYSIFNFIPKETHKDNYYLRYCPKCVEEDRNAYGEAYYHVNHQIPNTHICSKHCCELIDTVVPAKNFRRLKIVPLEFVIDSMDVVEVDKNDIRYKISKYLDDVLFEDLNINFNKKRVCEVLNSYIDNKYIRTATGHKNNSKFIEDLNEFYKGIKEFNLNGLQSIYCDNNWNPYEICLLGLFENINPKDLVKRKIRIFDNNKRINWKELDEELTKRFIEYSKNLTIKEIKELDLIKLSKTFKVKKDHIYDKLPLLYKEFHKVKKKYNLNNLDDECCSTINKLVDEDYFKGKVITMNLISGALGLSINTLRHLPKLRQLIIDLEIRYNGRSFYRKKKTRRSLDIK